MLNRQSMLNRQHRQQMETKQIGKRLLSVAQGSATDRQLVANQPPTQCSIRLICDYSLKPVANQPASSRRAFYKHRKQFRNRLQTIANRLKVSKTHDIGILLFCFQKLLQSIIDI